MPTDHDRGVTPEEQNEPNFRIYANWDKVLTEIPGFKNSTCLRRVRCPNHRGDMDFLLVTGGPEPKLGLVEVEGYDTKEMRDKPISRQGTDQLTRYLDGYRPFRGNGKSILEESIKNAFEIELRKLHNAKHWPGGVLEWARRADPNIQTAPHVADLLSAASKNLVAILLYFRTAKFTEEEYATLGRYLEHRPFYAGTVRWPEGDTLRDGRFL